MGAVVLAGCANDPEPIATLPSGPLDQKQYESAFGRSATGLAAKYGVGAPLSGDASAADQAAHITGLQKTLGAWAGRLASLHPPAAAARAQARYVAGIRSFGVDLNRAKAVLDRGDTKGAAKLLSSGAIVSPGTRADLVAARRAFHALGYDLLDLDKSPVTTG